MIRIVLILFGLNFLVLPAQKPALPMVSLKEIYYYGPLLRDEVLFDQGNGISLVLTYEEQNRICSFVVLNESNSIRAMGQYKIPKKKIWYDTYLENLDTGELDKVKKYRIDGVPVGQWVYFIEFPECLKIINLN